MANENVLNDIDVSDVEVKPDDLYTYKLSKPFEYEGKTIKEIKFDFDKLTGADSLAIENEMMSLGKFFVQPSLSGEYLMRFASRACGIGIDVLKAMPIVDFNNIRNIAKSFLMR